MNRFHTRWLAAAAATLFAVGCAQSNGDISYVQPNYTKKSDLLDGVWYIRNTVTKTPATTGFTFTGETGDLEKVVFEIQEGHLIAYRAYAQVPGQDQNIDEASRPSGTTAKYCHSEKPGDASTRVCTGGHKYYGAPIYAWPIKSHFDIQRGYNAATGETTNVISENKSDRPWNDREYIRVDWAGFTGNANIGTFGMLNPNGDSDYAAMIYANEPGTDPYDWPRQEFEEKNGEQKLKYFEYTGRYMARPDTYYFRGYGSYPICYFSASYDCTASQIEMRTSIARVDPNQTLDYEPLVYTNDLMNKFGYFRTERLNYDRRFGYFESDVLYLANRHRVWKHSFARDAQGNVDWSQPIPMAQRQPKPIAYYVAPAARMGGEAEYQKYWEASKILEKNWDRAFRRAVAAAQGKGDDWQSVRQMVYVCPNPVPADARADEIEVCGQPGFEARFGDLRYSFLWTIPEAVPNGLLGYGPSSADPETGEIISANANTYSAAVARSAQHTMDMVNVLTGDVTINELIRGQDVRDYILSHPSYAGIQGKVGPLKSELQGTDVQKTNATAVGAFQRPTTRSATLLQRLKSSGGLPQQGGDRMHAAAEMLRSHPQLEAALLDNPELGPDMMTTLPKAVRDAAEQNPAVGREVLRTALLRTPELLAMEKARQDYFARKNICFNSTDFEDRPMMSTALREANRRQERITKLVAEGQSPANAREIADGEMRARFQQHIWRATSEHEMGHTLGLRHNFQGSFDAINYFDGYWDLKKETLTVEQNGQRVVPLTPGDLKAASDGTELQLAAGLHDHEYSSIMDYGGKSNADWQGVGKYDEAAILFAYSGGSTPGYVEVFNAPLRTDVRQFDTSSGEKLAVTGAGFDLPVVNALKVNTAVPGYTERFHYSTVPLHFGDGADMEMVIASGIANLKRRTVEKWSVVKEKNEQLRQLLENTPVPTQADLQAIGAVHEVPYMFCTDDHAGYVLSCNRWDRGPDYYEMNRTWLEDYWNSYFFNHFRRDRLSFSSNGAFNSAANAFINSSSIYKHWVHAMYGGQGANAQNVPNYVNTAFGYDPLVQNYWTMATLDGINDLLKVMSVPPAGFYIRRPVDETYDTKVDLERWDVLSEGYDFDDLSQEGKTALEKSWRDRYGAADQAKLAFVDLPRGQARKMYSRYDYKSGFGFWNRLTEVGHYNDQMGALIAAVLPQADFLGVDDIADQNRYYIPYYLTFRDELNHVFGALWSDENAVRPTMYLSTKPDGTKKGSLQFPVHVRGENFVKGFNYPAAPQVLDPKTTMAAPANVQTTWTSRIYALYFGMILFNVNYDLDYAKQNQVFRLGGSEDLAVPAGWEKFEVQDPFTGGRYAAMQQVGSTVDTPAVKMVKEALVFKDIIENPKRVLLERDWGNQHELDFVRNQYGEAFRDQIRDLDLMRGMYQVYGKAF